ncbi:MAG: hypothetical protein KC438_10895, partial [Thermomicrobiales bacterium]|nr:hypothetical protein [Thermomicrobiales bacterium]
PVIADGIHKPYAHSIVSDYHAESIARLTQMRDQWTKIKQKHAVDDVSDAPFREADIAAQFAGSAKGGGKGISRSIKAEAAKWKKPKPVDIETAIGSIRDPELRRVLLRGDGKLTAEAAMQLDRPIPDSWSPPGYKGFPKLGAPKTEWNMKEGLDWLHEYAAQTPGFDYLKARNELGALMKGIEPRRTKAEVRSMKDAARAAGLDPKIVKDGTSRIEWAASTLPIRILDGILTYIRSIRMYNAITGTPGRLGDIAGNMVTHLVAGQDPWSAVRQLPLTFSNTYWYRKAARDPEKLIERWAIDAPHMAETGTTYTKQTFSGSVKLAEEQTTQLPWLNEKAKGAPVGVRAAANLVTVPYLKDITVGGELLGRKLAFDRAFTHSLKHEGLISFLAELKKTYPDTYQQLYKDILSSAQEKGGKRWGGLFSYEDVRKVTDEQTARFWQRKINDAVAKGDAEADRLFFSNRNTNADEVARRTFTFHYWMVRASALYARSLLQNPGMLSGIYRMYAELEQMAQEDNLPGFLGPMFKFYRTSGGMYGAFDPIGILFPTIAFDAYSQEGNKFQAFQNLLNPILSGALGALGLTQHIPDATGTRTVERFIIDMGNFLKGEGYDLESIPGLGNYIDNDSLTLKVPTEEFTKFLIGGANAFTGGIFGDFTPFDREANETDQLRSIGIRIGQGLWGEDINTWTPEQVAELEAAVQQAMTGAGEETWLSETIRAEYGREGFVRAGASFFVPGGVVTRQEFRDQQIEASRDYWDSFYAGKPTTKEGESAAAGRQLATSTQPVWVAMNNAYYEIGTKEQQQQYSVYNDLLFNPEELNSGTTIVVDNGNGTYTFFTAGELAGMEYADRFKILEAWAANTEGMADAIKIVGEGRKQFKAEHPDYAAYSEYQKGVYGYDGGPNQFRKDMADHPQFAAAMEAKRKDLAKQGKTGAVLEAEIDSWAASQQAFFAMMGEPWKLDDNLPGGTPGPSSVFAMDRLRPKDEEGSSSSGSTGGKTVKDPNVDDYWSPEKGVPRLAQDYAQYEFDNAEMERRFGP